MSADLIHHRAWRWAGHTVGTTHTSGPQPLRSAEKDEPPYEPPAERTLPFGFNLPAPDPEPDQDMPGRWEGDDG